MTTPQVISYLRYIFLVATLMGGLVSTIVTYTKVKSPEAALGVCLMWALVSLCMALFTFFITYD